MRPYQAVLIVLKSETTCFPFCVRPSQFLMSVLDGTIKQKRISVSALWQSWYQQSCHLVQEFLNRFSQILYSHSDTFIKAPKHLMLLRCTKSCSTFHGRALVAHVLLGQFEIARGRTAASPSGSDAQCTYLLCVELGKGIHLSSCFGQSGSPGPGAGATHPLAK